MIREFYGPFEKELEKVTNKFVKSDILVFLS